MIKPSWFDLLRRFEDISNLRKEFDTPANINNAPDKIQIYLQTRLKLNREKSPMNAYFSF